MLCSNQLSYVATIVIWGQNPKKARIFPILISQVKQGWVVVLGGWGLVQPPHRLTPFMLPDTSSVSLVCARVRSRTPLPTPYHRV